jgi:hypothetical protein
LLARPHHSVRRAKPRAAPPELYRARASFARALRHSDGHWGRRARVRGRAHHGSLLHDASNLALHWQAVLRVAWLAVWRPGQEPLEPALPRPEAVRPSAAEASVRQREALAASERPGVWRGEARASLSAQWEAQAVPHAAAGSLDAVGRPSAESHGEAEARRAVPLREAGVHVAALHAGAAAQPDEEVRHAEERPLAAHLLAEVPSFLRVRFRREERPARAGPAWIVRATTLSSTV